MKILLVGNFGSGNIGDELILCSALREYPNTVVMTANPEFSCTFCERRIETIPFPPTGFRSLLKYLFSSRYRKALGIKGVQEIVFPGGGLFAIKFKACWIWFCIFLWVRKMYTPSIHFLHQGVDENLGFFSKLLAKYVFLHSEKITVRDDESVVSVKKICGKNVKNEQDNLQSSIFNLQLKKRQETREKGQVLVNARAKFDAKILTRFEGQKIIFVAFDRSDLKCVPKDFSGEVVYPQTEKEVFELFSCAQYAIGERFHFLLLGAHFCGSENTFTLREPYAEKVKNFCIENNIASLGFILNQ